MRLACLLLLLGTALSGCSGSDASQGEPAPALEWGTMDVATVPIEPWEARGIIRVQWTQDAFAVSAIGEGGMPARAVLVGDTLYTTDNAMGWTEWDLQDFVGENNRGFRYLAWDARTLLQGSVVTQSGEGSFTARGEFDARGDPYEVGLEVSHEGSVPSTVVISTNADVESPYTLTRTQESLPFDPSPPADATPSADVPLLEQDASDAHAQILDWIDSYVSTLGRVPDEVTPESLALQRLDQSWPQNPFDQSPVADEEESGHFAWAVCSTQDAQYRGYGLDGEILGKSYGAGCQA